MEKRSHLPRIVIEASDDFSTIEVKIFKGSDPEIDPQDDEKVVWDEHSTHEEQPSFRLRVKTRVLLALLGFLTGGVLSDLFGLY